ncbi:hypothetical protein ACJRO7_016354 [Eucalyptus globulus]|uniref:Uncharacterized protein n=1 Tax=Eucalyptus globulus TaxID=34317 RepID=A0ABD3LCA5_EUCGL
MIDQYIFSVGKQRPVKKPRKKMGFGKRCLRMAKQQKTRVYILYRCTYMLLCWRDHSVSD